MVPLLVVANHLDNNHYKNVHNVPHEIKVLLSSLLSIMTVFNNAVSNTWDRRG